MLLRPLRSYRLPLIVVGALLASPLLGGCGFNYQTNRVNTISAGTNDQAGSVDVLGAVVIAGQDDVGLFVATLVNNNLTEPAELSALQPTEQVAPSEGDEPVEIPAAGRTSLFQTGGIAVGGNFGAGDFVDVTLAFANGQVTTLSVPVVTPCRQFSLEKLTELTLPTPSLDAGAGTVAPSPSASTAPTGDAPTEADGEPGKYSCEQAEPVVHGEPSP